MKSTPGLVCEILLKINLDFLLRNIGASLNFKIELGSLHISPVASEFWLSGKEITAPRQEPFVTSKVSLEACRSFFIIISPQKSQKLQQVFLNVFDT
jgi:hypothetical protein